MLISAQVRPVAYACVAVTELQCRAEGESQWRGHRVAPGRLFAVLLWVRDLEDPDTASEQTRVDPL